MLVTIFAEKENNKDKRQKKQTNKQTKKCIEIHKIIIYIKKNNYETKFCFNIIVGDAGGFSFSDK